MPPGSPTITPPTAARPKNVDAFDKLSPHAPQRKHLKCHVSPHARTASRRSLSVNVSPHPQHAPRPLVARADADADTGADARPLAAPSRASSSCNALASASSFSVDSLSTARRSGRKNVSPSASLARARDSTTPTSSLARPSMNRIRAASSALADAIAARPTVCLADADADDADDIPASLSRVSPSLARERWLPMDATVTTRRSLARAHVRANARLGVARLRPRASRDDDDDDDARDDARRARLLEPRRTSRARLLERR